MSAESPDTSRERPVVTIELEEAIARARASAQWQAGDRAAVPLAKRRDLSVTLLLLRTGARLAEHSAQRSITVQVVRGAIRFTAAGTVHTLRTGMILMLEHQVPHAVEALEESVLLLTAGLG